MFEATQGSWTCPYCNREGTPRPDSIQASETALTIPNASGLRFFRWRFVVCPYRDCQRFALTATLHGVAAGDTGLYPGMPINVWQLIPPSGAKTFPDCVPKAIVQDYQEAYLIRDLSPKASATLARRSLQGMLRDFWGVKGRRNLKEEIDAVKDRVDSLTWEAIDAVRRVGNIGAHMEQDINLIIDVEPQEAGILIGLVEMLINEWYVARQKREKALNAVKAIADAKDKARDDAF